MRRFQRFFNLIPLVLLGFVAMPVAGASAGQVLVAAASDLRFALEEIVTDFSADTGNVVTPVFGSSGNFARQIRQGAPFQMYMSADESYVFDLQSAGVTRDAGRVYALGRIVLVAPRGSTLGVDPAMAGLARLVRDGQLRRFAIANPDHAPYGARAREALQYAGLWTAIKPDLVLGENVGQATQFALSGSTQGGIVAYSLVLSPTLGTGITYALIPADWHTPLRQRMVLTTSAGPVAEAFYAYLQTPKALAVLKRFGFVAPENGS